jgi:hypothetical protein
MRRLAFGVTETKGSRSGKKENLDVVDVTEKNKCLFGRSYRPGPGDRAKHKVVMGVKLPAVKTRLLRLFDDAVLLQMLHGI